MLQRTPMSDLSEPLREEHEQIFKKIERLRRAAEAVGAAAPEILGREIDRIDDFLLHQLLPHALAEEEVLYPAVGKILGTPRATATMSLDHAEISRLAEQLRKLRAELAADALDAESANDLRRVLYGLYVLTKLHLAKEEEVYLPLLDEHLGEQEAHELLHKMADVAHQVGAPADS